jgi:hypothetical protein
MTYVLQPGHVSQQHARQKKIHCNMSLLQQEAFATKACCNRKHFVADRYCSIGRVAAWVCCNRGHVVRYVLQQGTVIEGELQRVVAEDEL